MTPAFTTTGCTAIITGASSGLGVEFAGQLAESAACLLLAARRGEVLEAVANELRTRHPHVKIVICACDLASDEGRSTLWAQVDAHGLKPALLVNNAGMGDYGAFASATTQRLRAQIDLNITAPTLLAHEFASRVKASADEPAGIINVASLAATLPIPDLAVYAATKAYVLSLSEALSVELAEQHIQVTCVCPGPTPTHFGKNARRAGEKDIDRTGQGFLRVSPEKVVADALRALGSGKACIFPSSRVTIAALVFRLMPRILMRFLIRLRYKNGRRNT